MFSGSHFNFQEKYQVGWVTFSLCVWFCSRKFKIGIFLLLSGFFWYTFYQNVVATSRFFKKWTLRLCVEEIDRISKSRKNGEFCKLCFLIHLFQNQKLNTLSRWYIFTNTIGGRYINMNIIINIIKMFNSPHLMP